MQIRAYKPREGSVGNFVFPRNNIDIMDMDDAMVNVLEGEMTIYGTPEDAAFQVMSLFAWGTLCVLVVPRPSGWTAGKPIETEATESLPLNKMAFLKACGLDVESPSNFYRRQERKYNVI